MSRPRNQRGSAGAVLVVGIGLSVAAVFYTSVLLIAWFAAARHAEQAAELAALAAVGAAVAGLDPCTTAHATAALNEATMASCTVLGEGRHVVVEVGIVETLAPAPTLPGMPTQISRSASAASD